jgi:hypothetical protein
MNFNAELNSINDFVSYVKTCKEAMRQALISQEQDVPVEATLDTYADYIAAIEGGGGTVYTVQYLDWDGTVLKSQQVLPGGDVLPPLNPTREYYTFDGWSATSENVQSDIIITAQYTYAPNVVLILDYDLSLIEKVNVPNGEDYIPQEPTREGLTFKKWSDPLTNITGNRIAIAEYECSPMIQSSKLYITLTPETGLSPTLSLGVQDSPISVSWGDGAVSINIIGMNASISHTYSDYGTYVITAYGPGRGHLGWAWGLGTDRGPLSAPYTTALRKAYASTNASTNVVSVSGRCFQGCTNLSQVMIPEGVNSILKYQFDGCISLESLVIPSTLTQFYQEEIFKGCTGLKKLVFKGATPPTAAAGALSGIPIACKVYVPDAGLEAYQTAFSTYLFTIYPISELAADY